MRRFPIGHRVAPHERIVLDGSETPPGKAGDMMGTETKITGADIVARLNEGLAAPVAGSLADRWLIDLYRNAVAWDAPMRVDTMLMIATELAVWEYEVPSRVLTLDDMLTIVLRDIAYVVATYVSLE